MVPVRRKGDASVMEMGRTEQTAEAWAQSFILAETLGEKLQPVQPPGAFSQARSTPLDLRPGRPRELKVMEKAPRLRGAHRSKLARAKAAHTFLHHELQAAELMCWCLLRFPDTPQAFKRGLVHIALDEVRHMQMYAEYLEDLGFEVGAFPVRDWFWERVPRCTSPLAFVSTMGMGFEAANIDHSERFAEVFEAAGDEKGAALQRKVGKEEIPHVRFAVHWYKEWQSKLEFSEWETTLPTPLSPMLMQGRPLRHEARQQAGLDASFCKELEAWQPFGF